MPNMVIMANMVVSPNSERLKAVENDHGEGGMPRKDSSYS